MKRAQEILLSFQKTGSTTHEPRLQSSAVGVVDPDSLDDAGGSESTVANMRRVRALLEQRPDLKDLSIFTWRQGQELAKGNEAEAGTDNEAVRPTHRAAIASPHTVLPSSSAPSAEANIEATSRDTSVAGTIVFAALPASRIRANSSVVSASQRNAMTAQSSNGETFYRRSVGGVHRGCAWSVASFCHAKLGRRVGHFGVCHLISLAGMFPAMYPR